MQINGNVLVGQSGGPTAVINSSLAGVFCGAKMLGAKKVFGMVNGIEGILNSKYIDMEDYLKNDEDIELLKRTPSSFLGSCRFKLPKVYEGNKIYETLFKFFAENDIECVLYIGGNDSMDTVKNLYDYAKLIGQNVKFIGVPKTIDNDLEITDHTPGYGSAAKYIATVTKELVRDCAVYDLKSVTVMEIMGRDSGWLTAAAALSKGNDCEGPDMIFLPERPFDMDFVKYRINELQKNKKPIVIAVSEGVRTADGKYICEADCEIEKDIFGNAKLSAAGAAIAGIIKRDLGIKTRAVELSTLQRCAAHVASMTDLNEAFEAGFAAAKAAAEGHSGEMILLKRTGNNPYSCITDTADVHNIANLKKVVPDNMINDNGDYVTEDFCKYALPLIEGEVNQHIVRGLPGHILMRR